MDDEVSLEFLQQIHELSSELTQLKLSYVQDFSNLLSKLETLESAHRDRKSLFEQMRSQLASHCQNETNLVHQLRHSDASAIFVHYYDVTEKIQRVRGGEKVLSLGVSGRFSLRSHDFQVYAEISRRNEVNCHVRLYFKEYRPTTSFSKVTWPFRAMLEVHASQVTKNLFLESQNPPGKDGQFVKGVDILSMSELLGDETVKEKDFLCVSIRVTST